MHTSVPVYSRLLIPHAKRTHTQNAHKRSGLLPPADSTTFAAQRYIHTQNAHTRKMHTSVPVYSRLLIPHAKRTHTQNAHKRSGLLPPSDSTTFAAQRYTHAKRTHAKCTQAFRFTPAFSDFHNFRSAEVYTRKTHTRKMHTSVPVYSRLLIPQLSQRRGIHTQNAHTQNAHKRSGLLPPAESTTFAAQRYTHAKRTRAKCTQAFRFTPAC